MILLTRLGKGLPIALNPDLIERAEPTPDTVITLVDGHKLVVAESVSEVIELIRQWRASVASSAYRMSQLRVTQAPLVDVPEQYRGHPALAGRDELPVAPTVHGPEGEPSEDDVSAHDTLGNSLARVLKLPPREG
jgi:flagellar protein FlbD